ncbi:MAG TPA: multiheme c-type cytochrome [Bacteroidota bacterium]|jgi:cytochrome c peroxidase
MKPLLVILGSLLWLTIFTIPASGQEKAANKYVGVKMCAPCHKAEKTGNQFGVWSKTKHSEAYKALLTPAADAVAKKKGLTKPAAESPECLQCHTVTGAATAMDKTFDAKDGVQCEACHGPGSAYKSMAIMKDSLKAVAAGLTLYADNAAIEKKCVTCHNDKSPTFKEFKFDAMWPKIKHPRPKKS